MCKDAICGDGLVWTGHEECDNGPKNNDAIYDGCTTQCKRGPHCDDMVVQDPEVVRQWRRERHRGVPAQQRAL